MSIKFNKKYVSENYPDFQGYADSDPIYYNLSVNAGFDVSNRTNFAPDASTITGTFTEVNQSPVVEGTGDYWISLMRCSIPTASVPRMIYPVQTGQADVNLTYNQFTLSYFTDASNSIVTESLNVIFTPEIVQPTPVSTGNFALPRPPLIEQDTSNFYYYVFYIQTILTMFNKTLTELYVNLRASLASQSIFIPPDKQPFFSYDDATQLFSINAPSDLYNNSIYPQIKIYIDDFTQGITSLSTFYVTPDARPTPPCIWQLTINNLYTNIIFIPNSENEYYKMQADQSSLPSWGGLQKIVFQINQGISVKITETDSIPTNLQNSSNLNFQKPNLPLLTDIEIDKDQWAKNTQIIAFQASSIEQVRLISLGSNQPVQNFQISIYWTSITGVRYPLYLPSWNIPITLKLAFFKKKKL